MTKVLFGIWVIALISVVGCFSFNYAYPMDENGDGTDGGAETVLLANTNNVYRFATNTILRVKTQLKKNGKWVECEHRVLVPEDWFIVSGDGLE